MATITGQVIFLAICTLVSFSTGANNEESQQNKIEEDASDAGSRNARFIKHQSQNPYNTDGYFYPNRDYPVVNQYPGGGSTQFYPERPNKYDPNYWLSKLPGFGRPTTSYPQGGSGYYPNPSYPNYYPGSGTNFIGYNPNPSRYPGGYHTSYPQSGYPSSGYPSSGYPSSGYPSSGHPSSGYPSSGYPSSGYPSAGYPSSGYPSSGYPSSGYLPAGNGGYGGYQGNGGLNSYSGYDGYYAAGNRPGNTGFGYQNSRTNGIVGPRERYPNTLLPIATPSTVSKDAK